MEGITAVGWPPLPGSQWQEEGVEHVDLVLRLSLVLSQCLL